MVALGVKQVEKFEAYLGLPTLVGRVGCYQGPRRKCL